MTRIVFVGDLHLADRPPLGRAPGYRGHVLAKLAEIGAKARSGEADAVIFLGDIFHQPRANLVSHGLVQQVALVLRASFPDDCPLYAVMGNHDMGEEGFASLSRQPLGVLDSAGVLKVPRLGDVITVRDVKIAFRHYSARRDLDPTYYNLEEGERDCEVLVCHGSLVPPGKHHRYPTLSAEALLTEANQSIRLIVSGHLHEDYGVTLLPSGHTYFANLGSVTRVARDAHNYRRRPSVLLAEIAGAVAGPITLWSAALDSALPASEVFVAREEGVEEADSTAIQAFAEALRRGLTAEELPIEELLAGLGDTPPAVKTHVIRLLQEAADAVK